MATNKKQASLMGDIGNIAKLYGAQGKSLLGNRTPQNVKGAKKEAQPSRQNIIQRLWQRARGLI